MAYYASAELGCHLALGWPLPAQELDLFAEFRNLTNGRPPTHGSGLLGALAFFGLDALDGAEKDGMRELAIRPGEHTAAERAAMLDYCASDADALARLLRAAGSSPVAFRHTLTGADRVMVYRVALGSGFRAAELAALVPDNFDLDANPSALVLPPEFSKNRKGAVQPLSSDLAADLRGYLRGRPGKEPVWPGTWADRSADMLKIDISAAGVPSDVDGPEGVEVRDFHALRNCFISDVLRAGADLKQAMTVARHSDPRLTTARYGRTRLHDLGAVVDKLPTPTRTVPEPTVLRLTGTDSGSSKGAAVSGSGRVQLRTIGETGGADGPRGETKQPPASQGFEDDREQSGTIGAERAGFEPAVGFYPHAALAKRCFRPLSHLSVRREPKPAAMYRNLSTRPRADNPRGRVFGCGAGSQPAVSARPLGNRPRDRTHAVARHSLRNRTPCSMSRKRSSCVPTSRSMHSGPR